MARLVVFSRMSPVTGEAEAGNEVWINQDHAMTVEPYIKGSMITLSNGDKLLVSAAPQSVVAALSSIPQKGS